MILPLIGLLAGASVGVAAAWRRGGTRLDLAQWGAVGAIVGGVAGLFLLILVQRAALG